MPFWNASLLTPAALLVAANALAQLTFVFARLGPLTCASAPGAAAVLTHAAAKAAAGLGVLDVLHNGSVALLAGGGQGGAAPVPGLAVEVATGVVFAVLACASDWLLGACLVFDLVALAVGQSGYGNAGWAAWLAVYAGGVAVVVAARSGVWKLYARTRRDGYQTLD